MSSKFILRSDVITSYRFRDSDNKLAILLPRTNYYKNSFAFSDAVLWNSYSKLLMLDAFYRVFK